MFLQPQVRGPWRDALRITPSYRCQRGPRSSIWSFHHETNRDFKDAGRQRLLGREAVCSALPHPTYIVPPHHPRNPYSVAGCHRDLPSPKKGGELGGGGRWG